MLCDKSVQQKEMPNLTTGTGIRRSRRRARTPGVRSTASEKRRKRGEAAMKWRASERRGEHLVQYTRSPAPGVQIPIREETDDDKDDGGSAKNESCECCHNVDLGRNLETTSRIHTGVVQ